MLHLHYKEHDGAVERLRAEKDCGPLPGLETSTSGNGLICVRVSQRSNESLLLSLDKKSEPDGEGGRE